jgi:hypothetical protein
MAKSGQKKKEKYDYRAGTGCEDGPDNRKLIVDVTGIFTFWHDLNLCGIFVGQSVDK